MLLSVQGLQALREENQVLEKLQALFQIKMDNWLQIDFTDWRGQNTIKKRSSRLREESFRGGFFSLTT